MFIVSGERNENDNNTNSWKPSITMKTSKSLDASLPVPFTGKKPIMSSTSSLESMVPLPDTIVADKQTDNFIHVQNNENTCAANYSVLGIGPPVSDIQMQKVLEYFKKCAANNGGYVYEFDIKSDQCPEMNAINI